MLHIPTSFQKSIAIMGAIIAPCLGQAQDAANLPLWEIGAVGVGVSQQAYPGSAEHVNRGLALPFLIYRGEYFRSEHRSAAFRAIKSNNVELDIGIAGAFGSSSKDVEARHGMADLGTLVEFGPRLKWKLGAGPGNGKFRIDLPLRGVFDLSDSLAFKGVTLEPELIFERESDAGWKYKTSVGAVWGNQRMADTFYGVDPIYATSTRKAYSAEGGLIAWRLSAAFSHKLSGDVRLLGFARLDSITGSANESSPLAQKTIGSSVGLGLTYTWQRSDAKAKD